MPDAIVGLTMNVDQLEGGTWEVRVEAAVKGECYELPEVDWQKKARRQREWTMLAEQCL
jgi:hypothetical protein